MSFLKSLFATKSNDPAKPVSAARQLAYKGFVIEARPYKESGEYQLAGAIVKEVDGVRKEHRFVRSDRFSDIDTAADFALKKGQQIIDERGDRVFD